MVASAATGTALNAVSARTGRARTWWRRLRTSSPDWWPTGKAVLQKAGEGVHINGHAVRREPACFSCQGSPRRSIWPSCASAPNAELIPPLWRRRLSQRITAPAHNDQAQGEQGTEAMVDISPAATPESMPCCNSIAPLRLPQNRVRSAERR